MRLAKDYDIEVVGSVESAGQLFTEWQKLWNVIPSALTFQRPEWILSWMQSFHPRELFLVTIRHKQQLVGIAPCLFYERRVQGDSLERVLGLMGGGVSDYLDILLDPRHAQNVMHLFWKRLCEEKSHYDVIEFTDLPASSCLLQNSGEPLIAENRQHDRCSFLSIPQGAKELKKVLPPHKWENIRNARNRLRRSGGGEIEIASENALDTALADLFRLHRARWAQESLPGVLNEHSVCEFHRNIAPALLRKNVLRLYSLRLNGSCIASGYIFFEREQALCYLHGYDPEFSRLSPGTLILAAVIEDAIREGKRMVNFLRGEEEYKKSWGIKSENTFCLHAKVLNQSFKESEAA